MKSTRLVLALLFFISFCSDSSTPISVSSLDDITGSTTNKIEISNSDWDSHSNKFFEKMKSMGEVRLPGERRHKNRLDTGPRNINEELVNKIKSLS